MSLEEAILAASTFPPQYWEKYPNIIDVEQGFSVAGSGTGTIASINAPGYLRKVYITDGYEATLNVALDGVTYKFAPSGSYAAGLVELSDLFIDGTSTSNTIYAPRVPGTSSASGSYSASVYPLSTAATTGGAPGITVLESPLQFKSSLTISINNNSTGSSSFSVLVKGGHA